MGLALGLEPLHFPFAPANRKLRIRGPVVLAQPARRMPALVVQQLQRGRVGSNAVGDECVRAIALDLEQFLQQFQCCSLVAPLMHERVENLALAIDGSPHVQALTPDAHDHLVEMPNAVGPGTGLADVRSDRGPEES